MYIHTYIYIYIYTHIYACIIYIQLSCYRPGSELTDHTEYALAVAFVSVGVVCQRNEQTRFVDITRRLDNSSLSTKTRGAYSRLNTECQYVYEQNLLIDTLTNSRLSFTLWERINLELRARGELWNRRWIFDLKYHVIFATSSLCLSDDSSVYELSTLILLDSEMSLPLHLYFFKTIPRQ